MGDEIVKKTNGRGLVGCRLVRRGGVAPRRGRSFFSLLLLLLALSLPLPQSVISSLSLVRASTSERRNGVGEQQQQQIVKTVRDVLRTRRGHIQYLREIAENHDRIAREFNKKRQGPRGTSLAGYVVTAGAGAAIAITSIATGGLAAPLWATLIGGAGAATSVFGGIWSITVERKKSEGERLLKERLERLIREDAEMMAKLKEAMEDLAMLDYSQQEETMRQLRTVVSAFIGLSNAFGSAMAFNVFTSGVLVPIKVFCQPIEALSSLLGPLITKGLEVRKESGGSDGMTESLIEEMQPGVGETVKAFVKQKMAEAKNLAKKSNLSEEAVKQAMAVARDEAMRTITQFSGGLQFGIGLAFALWDLKELADAVSQSQPEAKSKLGEALRGVAAQVEAELRRDRG